MSTLNNPDRAHESEDVHTPSILKFAAGIVVLIGVAIIACFAVLRFTAIRPDTSDDQAAVADSSAFAPPAPKTRLQIAPEAELQAYVRDKAAVLNSYGWTDRSAGRVRIPITQAIDLVAQRGLPVFTAVVPSSAAPGKEP